MGRKEKRNRAQEREESPARMGEDDIDLSWYLSVLDREQLELLCVRMITQNSFDFSQLENATAQLDYSSLLESVDIALAESADSTYFFSKALQPMVDRALMYCKIGRVKNALSVLVTISSAFATCACEDENLPEKTVGEEAEEREELDLFVANLESAWEQVVLKFQPAEFSAHASSVASGKGVIDMDEVTIPTTHKEMFATLAQWRTALTPIFGPLFSDALRVSKKMIVAEEKKSAVDAESQPIVDGGASVESQPPMKKTKQK